MTDNAELRSGSTTSFRSFMNRASFAGANSERACSQSSELRVEEGVTFDLALLRVACRLGLVELVQLGERASGGAPQVRQRCRVARVTAEPRGQLRGGITSQVRVVQTDLKEGDEVGNLGIGQVDRLDVE